jgi:uncharacterized membrane protein YdjX (TVP38/TMEM64 family)
MISATGLDITGGEVHPLSAGLLPSQLLQRIRATCFTLLGATTVLVIIDAKTTNYVETFFSLFIDWLSTHPASGILVVIVVYIVATVLFIPGSILTIGTGYAFRRVFSQSIMLAVLFSSIAVFIGASLGSIACLLLGRFLFREFVLELASQYPIFLAIDRGRLLTAEFPTVSFNNSTPHIDFNLDSVQT